MNNQHPRIPSDPDKGLNSQQVASQKEKGLVNGNADVKTKSIGRIIRDNVLTPFNLLNAILAALVILVGSVQNALFMGVIICNVIIGTFQEIRAKKTIDKLSLIATPKAHVIRDGVAQEISLHEIVRDDILVLQTGNQICSDAIIVRGECEVNESLLTGESDPVVKKPGDLLLSGSFLVSGTCRARVEHVGEENYTAKISASAKYIKKPNSEILFSINRIIKWIGFALIPIGLALFLKQMFLSGQPFGRAIVSTVAALVGMIPEGLVLLTSVVLAVSVIRLSRHKTLVQELFCIETLARVDVLCLDKTGTITEGTMELNETIPLAEGDRSQIDCALGALMAALPDTNPTADAIRGAYGALNPDWSCEQVVPFSSARKWSGAYFSNHGSYILGAAEFVLGEAAAPLQQNIQQYAQNGQRVLILAHSKEPFGDKTLPEHVSPLAFLVISDKIRPEARQTLEYFAEQGVELKVISGDNAVTVSHIAQRAGLKDGANYVDATTLKTPEQLAEAAGKYSVFGRVTPQQKLELVKALKKQGHTVAMTGDGVNDVLALKEADCSVAMASGSDAARTVSQLVLLDSNFASMPLVVREGRRSINNLQRSSSLFLVKTIFSTILAIVFIFLNRDYPFLPLHLTMISTVCIGAPSFLLALEPNNERIKGHFIANVLQKAIPGAITMALTVIAISVISSFVSLSQNQVSTLCVMATGFVSLLVLLRICLPFNWIRGGLFCLFSLAFAAECILAMYVVPEHLLNMVPMTGTMAILLTILCACAAVLMVLFIQLTDRLLVPLINRLFEASGKKLRQQALQKENRPQ
ncbi:MAG: cation-translocating P-type ATPase [Oscillospiraceae bacterium]|nr:cation-translocating P-type ATPase [Oscillospiraceae bacterium]